jgi:hypothetical protein
MAFLRQENIMFRHIAVAAVFFSICQSANADIWIWTDAKGEVHMVNSSKPLYTWLDESGNVHYSDTPDHEDAVSVELVWHSTGTAAAKDQNKNAPAKSARDNSHPGETEGDRVAREQAEAYYCKRAKEIYDSYLSAPRLYETDSNGDRVYLDKKQAAAKLAETESAVAKLCN